MNEENDPFAMTPPGSYELSKNDDGGHIDIEKDSVRDNINNLLAAVTASPAISPYTALERVRSRTMGMQRSDELQEAENNEKTPF